MAVAARRDLLNSAAIGAGGLAPAAMIPAQARARSETAQSATAPSGAAQPNFGAALPDGINTGNLPSDKYRPGAQPLKIYEGGSRARSEGGSAREVTVREFFPVSETIAGVDMRHKPGGCARTATALPLLLIVVGDWGTAVLVRHSASTFRTTIQNPAFHTGSGALPPSAGA